MAKSRSPVANNLTNHPSPRNRYNDSPSRQLHHNLEDSIAQLHLYDSERQKLHAYQRKSVQDELDARELAQAMAHKAEIDHAIARHEIVRQQAVAVLEAHIREEEERKRQQEEEERRQQEEQARRKAEETRRINEERERRAKEEREKAAAAKRAAERRAQAEEEEKQRQERESAAEQQRQAEQKAQADAEAAKAKQKPAQPAALTASAPPGDEAAWSSNPEIRHRQYLGIHRQLKVFRKDFWTAAKKDPRLKDIIGNMRREIRTSVGQLTTADKLTNSKVVSPSPRPVISQSHAVQISKTKSTLLSALRDIPSPPIKVNTYLPPHLGLLDNNTTEIPGLVIYLLSCFSKAVVNAFVGECVINIKSAEPIGIMVAQIFSIQELQFKRNVPSPDSGVHYKAFGGTVPTPPMTPSAVSLISILMSKFHAAAPILFGISGDEKLAAGRLRLGWRRELAGSQKSFVPDSKHYDRLAGLGAGYAAISLRNFGKGPRTNPWPPYHFWETLSFISNTNPLEVQPSHLIVLKSLLQNSVDSIIHFFGDEGFAALRKVAIEFPGQLAPHIQQSSAATSLTALVDIWKRERNLHLE